MPAFASAASFVHHEPQRKLLCGVHALNSLLQADYGRHFRQQDLDAVCVLLDPPRCCRVNAHRHWAGLGDYDVNVLLYALGDRGLEGSWFDARYPASRLRTLAADPAVIGLLVNGVGGAGLFGGGNHWYSIRRLACTWYDCNSLNRGPRQYVDVGEMVNDLQRVLDTGGSIIIIKDARLAAVAVAAAAPAAASGGGAAGGAAGGASGSSSSISSSSSSSTRSSPASKDDLVVAEQASPRHSLVANPMQRRRASSQAAAADGGSGGSGGVELHGAPTQQQQPSSRQPTLPPVVGPGAASAGPLGRGAGSGELEPPQLQLSWQQPQQQPPPPAAGHGASPVSSGRGTGGSVVLSPLASASVAAAALGGGGSRGGGHAATPPPPPAPVPVAVTGRSLVVRSALGTAVGARAAAASAAARGNR